MIKKIKRNKKGVFPIAVLFSVIVALFIIAPVILKVINESTDGFFEAMNSTSQSAVDEGSSIINKGKAFIDYIVVLAIILNIFLLFISSFFVDTHPVFLILYIFSAFIFVLFAPNLLDAVDTIWGEFSTESVELPLTDFLRSNSNVFILSIIVLTGLIIYAKFRFSNQYG